jgi:hypothetical protein
LCSLKYKIFKINILHVCGIINGYMQICFHNFLRLKNMIFDYLKNEITCAHVHQIFVRCFGSFPKISGTQDLGAKTPHTGEVKCLFGFSLHVLCFQLKFCTMRD